jgi:hypothetical protein
MGLKRASQFLSVMAEVFCKRCVRTRIAGDAGEEKSVDPARPFVRAGIGWNLKRAFHFD